MLNLKEYAETPVLLANEVPGLEADMGVLHFPSREERPALTAQSGPLAQAQQNGISFDQLLDLYAACGDDIRPHLTQD